MLCNACSFVCSDNKCCHSSLELFLTLSCHGSNLISNYFCKNILQALELLQSCSPTDFALVQKYNNLHMCVEMSFLSPFSTFLFDFASSLHSRVKLQRRKTFKIYLRCFNSVK